MSQSGIEKIEVNGITLVVTGGIIQAVELGEVTLHRHQEVISRGPYVTKGKKGVIEGFVLPYEDGRTSDFIDVLFEGDDATTQIKPKDLVL